MLYGFWSPRHSTAAYADAFEMFADAAEVGRSEIQELVSLGCEYIQVDAPELATLVDPRVRDWAECARASAPSACSPRASTSSTRWSRGSPACAWASTCAAATTRGCGWPAAATTTSPRRCSSARRPSTPSSSSTTTPARARSSRSPARPTTSRSCSGSSRPRRRRSRRRRSCGARIDEAARFVPREQLGLSTQCGFASIVAGNPITEADEERKLRLVADTAHAAWGWA